MFNCVIYISPQQKTKTNWNNFQTGLKTHLLTLSETPLNDSKRNFFNGANSQEQKEQEMTLKAEVLEVGMQDTW